MRVLLTEPGAHPIAATILVVPQVGGSAFETLSGRRQATGVVAEADNETLVKALSAGLGERDDYAVSAEKMRGDLRWIHKELADYEPGSKIGLGVDPKGRGYVLDGSEAVRINRAEGLAEGDAVAIGPKARPKALFNARGRVISINGAEVEVQVDPGDRDRIERATGKTVDERMTFHILLIERLG